MWSQGIHARSGVSCSDCHMPYKTVGGTKVSDHHVASPLLAANNACGTCHLAEEATAGVVAKPLANLGGKYSIDSLTRFFLSPTPPMPAFELPEEERRALAVHLLSRFE